MSPNAVLPPGEEDPSPPPEEPDTPEQVQFEIPEVKPPDAVSKTELGGVSGCLNSTLRWGSIIFIVLTFPISVWFCMRIVREYQRVVILRLGLFTGQAEGPGIFFVIPWTDNFFLVDMRVFTRDIPPQEILTKDSVTVAVDAVVYSRIHDPIRQVKSVAKPNEAIMLLARSVLQNILGTRTLHGILTERKDVSRDISLLINSITNNWGIVVERVEMTDIRLPDEMQRILAAEAESAQEAKAKLIAAHGEQKAAFHLKEASKIMSNSTGALQIRYLQEINNICNKRSKIIVFPLPEKYAK